MTSVRSSSPIAAAMVYHDQPAPLLSRRVLLLLKLVVSVLLIALVLRHIDLDSLTGRFAGQSRGWLLVAAAVTAVQILLTGLRWDQVVKGLGAEVPIAAVLRVAYIGAFLNSWLLGNAGGDVARAILAPDGGIGRTRIVYSVLFDRVVTVAALGLVVLPAIALNIGPFARTLPAEASLAVSVLPFAGLTALGLMARAMGGRPHPFAQRIAGLGLSWRRLWQAPARLGGALGIAAVSQIAIAAVAYSLARAQHLDVSLVDFVIAMPPVVLLAALPISIGGWGVRENAMVIAMAPLGIVAGPALLISVQMALLSSLASLPGGVIWAMRLAPRGAVSLAPAAP